MRFEVTNACNVRGYYRTWIEADSPEEAITKARAAGDWILHKHGDDADALEPSYWAQHADEDDASFGESCDEQDDPGFVYKTDLLAFVKMLAEACPEVGGLVNDNTGAMMSPEDIWKTARHILKLDGIPA